MTINYGRLAFAILLSIWCILTSFVVQTISVRAKWLFCRQPCFSMAMADAQVRLDFYDGCKRTIITGLEGGRSGMYQKC